LFRFFVVAPPLPPLMVATFVLIAAVGAAVLVVDATRGAAVVTPIIVLQLFASASGFEGPARRGHYDLLLTSGEGRLRVAVAHWLVSVTPGAAAGAVVGLVEVASGDSGHTVFSAGTFAAFFLVSTLPWALAVRLPRFAPSIGWILLLAMVPMVVPAATADRALRLAFTASPGYEAAFMSLLYPVSLVGQPFQPESALVVAPGLALASGAMLASLWWIAHADFPLEAAQ
jgi:hypothetical protein